MATTPYTGYTSSNLPATVTTTPVSPTSTFQTPSVVTPTSSSVSTNANFSQIAAPTTPLPSFTPPTVVPDTSKVAGIVAGTNENLVQQQQAEIAKSQEQQMYDAINQKIKENLGLSGTAGVDERKATDQANLMKTEDVTGKKATVKSLLAQIAANKVNGTIGGTVTPVGGITQGQYDSQIESKNLMLGAQLLVAQGQYDSAKEAVTDAITMKYAPEEARNNALLKYAEINKEALGKKADQIKELAQARIKDAEERKANETQIQSLGLTIAKNGAPASVVSALNKAKTFNDAVITASPYLQSKADKADLSYKVAQTAKIYNDIKESARKNGSNIDPSQSLAYAQEYAATGKIPTGIPKGGFGTVAQWAKELPKQNGEIISTATGVHPGQDSTYADALSNLSSVVKLAQDLKEQDKNRIGGVVGGTLGAITGSKAQGNYLSTRSQIVDLLSRARSGAALTENEVKTYEGMLPGRFSESFGVGQNSDVKIQQFVDSITKDMQNKAAAKGWSIYGVSKVKPQGADHEYTVGALIQANGQTGRVNADGSITLIQ